MASNAKKRTTMAKMQRENNVRERRLKKQARKDARKREAAEQATNPAPLADDAPAPTEE